MGIPGGARILIRYDNSKGVWDFQHLIGIPRRVPKSHWGSGEGKTTFDGRRPLMEDDLQWKETFDGRQLLMEDNL